MFLANVFLESSLTKWYALSLLQLLGQDDPSPVSINCFAGPCVCAATIFMACKGGVKIHVCGVTVINSRNISI